MVLVLGFGLKLNMPEVHLVISYGYYSYGASDMLGVYPLGIPGRCLIDASSCMGVEEAYETHPYCIPDMNTSCAFREAKILHMYSCIHQ